MSDVILHQMAVELCGALRAHGIDNRTSPDIKVNMPPTDRAFAEYRRRGGVTYSDPMVFVTELVAEVITL